MGGEAFVSGWTQPACQWSGEARKVCVDRGAQWRSRQQQRRRRPGARGGWQDSVSSSSSSSRVGMSAAGFRDEQADAALEAIASEKLVVMVNGVPGPMAAEVAHAVVRRKLPLVPYALTGPATKQETIDVDGVRVRLVTPESAAETLKLVKQKCPNVVCVDYTHPSSANVNATLYTQAGACYVMGTTGGDAERMRQEVNAQGDQMLAIIAPNMGKQIVAFQAAMKIMAEQFPGAFAGYTLSVTESHQSTKADTSGTAKAVVAIT